MWSTIIRDKKNLEVLLFAVIISLASFLRFYLLPFNMPFIGDQAKDFFTAVDMVEQGRVPLLGIESSMPQFRQGPVYIWLLAFLFAFFGYSPENAAYMAGSIGVLAVGAIYIYTRMYFGRKASLVASALLAVSPLTVAHSQLAFIINPIPLVSVGYLTSLLWYQKTPKATLFWPSLWFGLLFQFELAVAPLVALIPLAFVIKNSASKSFNLKSIIPAIKGLSLGLMPQIVYDLTHKFEHLVLFAGWVGYRIVSFLGYKNQHAFSPQQFENTLEIIGIYLHKTISWHTLLAILWIIIFCVGCIMWMRSPRKMYSPSVFIWSWVAVLLVSFIVHTSPSEAYFPSIAVPLFLGIGWAVSKATSIKATFLACALVIITMVTNSDFLIRSQVLGVSIPSSSGLPTDAWIPRYDAQLAIVNFVMSQDLGAINLRSMGPGSQFPAFLDNFRYLFWLQGAKLSPDGAPVWLLFGEEREKPPFINMRSYQFNDVTVSIPR